MNLVLNRNTPYCDSIIFYAVVEKEWNVQSIKHNTSLQKFFLSSKTINTQCIDSLCYH